MKLIWMALTSFAGVALIVGIVLARGAFAQSDPTPTPDHMGMMDEETPMHAASPTAGSSHEMMHNMMDMMGGPGTSDRMHEMMGPDAERMMESCAAMMDMMSMMGGQSDHSMPGMMAPTGTPGS